MRILRLITSGILVFLLTGGKASAQDLLRIFLPGDPQYQLIGGNPFSSLQSGDNTPFRVARDSKGFVRYDNRLDNYYSELRKDGSTPHLGARMQSLLVQMPLPSGARFGLAAQTSQLLSEARNTSDQTLNYDNTLKLIRLSYEAPLTGSIQWNVVLGHSNASSGLLQDAGASVSFHIPAGSLSLDVERSANSRDLSIAVAGVQGLLPLDHQTMTVRVGMASGGSAARIAVSGYQSAISPLPSGINRTLLHFLPAGFIRGWDALLETQVGPSWKGMVSLEGLSFEGNGTFTSSGTRYGRLDNAGYRNVSATAGLMTSGPSGSMFVADFKWMRVEGSFAGYAESWPFVSAMQSLFSQRGNFKAEGSFQLSQLHAGGLTPVTDWLSLGGGVTAMSILPALRIESWQPGLFGTGRNGYSDRRLSVDRIDGGMLSGGLRLHAGGIHIDYSISQFIPLSTRTSGPEAGTSTLFSTPQEGSVIRSWGGLFQRLSVAIELFPSTPRSNRKTER